MLGTKKSIKPSREENILERNENLGPFDMDKISSWTFQTGPNGPANIKDVFAWTRYLIGILDRPTVC